MPDPSMVLVGFLASGGAGWLIQPVFPWIGRRIKEIVAPIPRIKATCTDDGITFDVERTMKMSEIDKTLAEAQSIYEQTKLFAKRLDERERGQYRQRLASRRDPMTGDMVHVWQEREPILREGPMRNVEGWWPL